ncbi:MAG: hypothetical protein ACLR1G_09850 [Alistipes indistinctus]
MTVISVVAFVQSNFYLDRETLRQFKFYNISLMLLCVSATGVYFANNIAVTWIFSRPPRSVRPGWFTTAAIRGVWRLRGNIYSSVRSGSLWLTWVSCC